jgi:hypothetical protein
MASANRNYWAILSEEAEEERRLVAAAKKVRKPTLKETVEQLFKMPELSVDEDVVTDNNDWYLEVPSYGKKAKYGMGRRDKKGVAVMATLDEAAVFEDPDVWEALERKEERAYEAWLQKMREQQEEEAREQRETWRMYFYSDGSCCAHDWIGCRECAFHASGECPSAREEGWYDDGW